MPAFDVPKESELTSLTAVIHAADGVRFIAIARHHDALAAQIAEYIRERCDDVLWADDARQVHALLEEGRVVAAIGLYFARVGERWDEERLDVDAPFWATAAFTSALNARASICSSS